LFSASSGHAFATARRTRSRILRVSIHMYVVHGLGPITSRFSAALP
jgi:hypothetical protein